MVEHLDLNRLSNPQHSNTNSSSNPLTWQDQLAMVPLLLTKELPPLSFKASSVCLWHEGTRHITGARGCSGPNSFVYDVDNQGNRIWQKERAGFVSDTRRRTSRRAERCNTGVVEILGGWRPAADIKATKQQPKQTSKQLINKDL